MTDVTDTIFVAPANPVAKPGLRRAFERLRYSIARRPTTLLLGSVGLPAGLGLLFDESVFGLISGQILPTGGADAAGGGIGLAAAAGVLAARRLRRGDDRFESSPCDADVARAVEILGRQPNAAAGLVRLGDKRLLFSDCGDAFIMYARRGRSMVALFDPVGARETWTALVLKFMRDARSRGCRPVFYQVSPEFLSCAIEAGLKPYKLGEQAVVDLTTFSLAGGDWLKLRRSINRAERDGLTFDMVAPADVPEILPELAAVSDAWLAAHNAGEKGFSLGTFKEHYVASEPVAVIRLEGRIIAFASVLTTASGGDAFIDLMRHIPNTHRGAMDLLFVRIMEYLKQNDFRSLNLGMAPLAGLSAHDRAPLWNRIGRQVFENGERFYNFRGVLEFKSKFDPRWQPRYLAVPGRGFPLVAMLDVTLLIGGGLKGVLRR
ncbi:bifunctional lysylphosphatidylglycerol flippase/synthetase MprF [Ciceribacter sp. L1K23]|uniref:phosphatidylglycerol lysyltransferase domain-containing protein n=1 Tax=unclassified Ciceribacter TaxID=2628820 RepID=UPI001ABDCBBE|nr:MULTISPECIES: phosphatidylglycerol lysyltransferase domain-containing protein [unclassified Ciceribacter]MBO3759239.1 bifunctional lysylphosphatidylglycerol flippase/synthetase MprF [Ciceribacter sp. L1K22]MBR0556613.1 bifunctional lysylphosphatidylglycerol flippase/synthetase MprF [Ciceribacter sp. L1K23]